MGKDSGVSWTDHSFSPWWGCTHVSPGCESCYAETFSDRLGHRLWGATATRRFFDVKHWREPLRWNRAACTARKKAFVFCAPMADVFERHQDPAMHGAMEAERSRLFCLIERTESLVWLLLTKRPGNVRSMVPPQWLSAWPGNAWLGFTAEDQRRLDDRWLEAHDIPAPIIWVSAEPLLGGLALDACEKGVCPECAGSGELAGDPLSDDGMGPCESCRGTGADDDNPGLGWVVWGGESGRQRRECEVAWIADGVRQCRDAGVPAWVKQDSHLYPGRQGRIPDKLWAVKERPEA